MKFTSYGINIHPKDQGMDKVTLKGIELSLIASGDGTEIIHHRLEAGASWSLAPEENWEALEFIYLISGRLICKLDDSQISIEAGQSLSANPIRKQAIFVADTVTDFLYISSRPVYHLYSQSVWNMMELVIAVEEKDGYTANHCQRIKELSMQVGEQLKLNPTQLYNLNIASFLHDIGKVKVPDHILGKPGQLTEAEWEIMKLHTTYGREVLEETGLPFLLEPAKIVEQHHERCDGSGYPYGLMEKEIKIEAAIIAVVDSYDAMTTNRVYQKGRSKAEALQELTDNKGIKYHKDVVEAFIALSNNI